MCVLYREIISTHKEKKRFQRSLCLLCDERLSSSISRSSSRVHGIPILFLGLDPVAILAIFLYDVSDDDDDTRNKERRRRREKKKDMKRFFFFFSEWLYRNGHNSINGSQKKKENSRIIRVCVLCIECLRSQWLESPCGRLAIANIIVSSHAMQTIRDSTNNKKNGRVNGPPPYSLPKKGETSATYHFSFFFFILWFSKFL